MWMILMMTTALAGELVFDAKVPADVGVGGAVVARVYQPSVISVPMNAGSAEVFVFTYGKRTDLKIEVPEVGQTRVLIGRTGISISAPPAKPEGTGPAHIELRSPDSEDVMLIVDGKRHIVRKSEEQSIDLAPGSYPISVRNAAGTVIWAKASLELQPGADVVLQLTSGREPEISGSGGRLASAAP